MWAYISDVLGFYDERTANETYIRTAVRRPSLRRIVELLGYTPSSGVAATASVAALADGAVAVTLPPATGFRSSAFAAESPQVFETTAEWTIHPLKNQWKVITFKRRPTVDAAPDATDTGAATNQKKGSPSTGPNVRNLLFETAGFGLAANELVLFDSRQAGVANPVSPPVTLVTATASFEGKDSLTYIRAALEPAVTIQADTDLSTLRARRPTQTATPTINEPVIDVKTTAPPVENVTGGTRAFFDQLPTAFRRSDPIIVARNLGSAEAEYAFATISSVRVGAVKVTSIPPQTVSIPQPDSAPDLVMTIPSPTVAATELTIQPALPTSFVTNAEELTFLFDFVDGGQPTNSGKTEVSAADLTGAEEIPLDGIVSPPPEAIATAAAEGLSQTSNVTGVLEQEFLISDAAKNGVAADGRITFTSDGRASFQALAIEQLPTTALQLPLTIYGNVVETTRGESVFGEVLGNGDARIANQRFKLRKKPLTYLPLSSPGGSATPVSTLQIYVDGVLWNQVRHVLRLRTGGHRLYGAPRRRSEHVRNLRRRSAWRPASVGCKERRRELPVWGGRCRATGGEHHPARGLGEGLALRAHLPSPPARARIRTSRNNCGPMLREPRCCSGARFPPWTSRPWRASSPESSRRGRNGSGFRTQMQAGVVVLYIGEADSAVMQETLRSQADPTVPIEVTKAQPIPATVSIGVEVDERHVKETVAAAVLAYLTAPGTGVLSLEQARIGGSFWPSVLYEAVSQVDGVIAVSGVSFSTGNGGPQISTSIGTCIETGKYLDFSAPDSVTVTGVDPIGSAPAGSGT